MSIFDEYEDVHIESFDLSKYPDIIQWAIHKLERESGDFVLPVYLTEILAIIMNKVWEDGRKNPIQ